MPTNICRVGVRRTGLRVSHGMLQPVRLRVRRVPGLCWPAVPVQGTAGVGWVVPSEQVKDLLLLAVGWFGAGPRVLSLFAAVPRWGSSGCKAGSCSGGVPLIRGTALRPPPRSHHP